ncbi:MAG: acyl-CoA reductase [Bacteroidetes bacterium]|nr:acyl-CoA reductase [Bacteroidota bacterium]
MSLERRINVFSTLGKFLRQFADKDAANEIDDETVALNTLFYDQIENAIRSSVHYNGWFIESNVRTALGAFAQNLNEKDISEWIEPYRDELEKDKGPLKVGVIMAGNIPLAGFHDFLSVLIAGNTFFGKLSSSDRILLPLISEVLIEIEPEFKTKIIFSSGRIDGVQAVIATGSNNTYRYFEYYFGKYPKILRKNRNSVAVLSGNETPMNLFNLGYDIFQYFGLGCRNISKLYVPEAYDFDKFFAGIFEHQPVENNHKYANNYMYNKTVYLLNNHKLLENGFLILKEDKSNTSPVGMLFYEYYDDFKTLEPDLNNGLQTNLQCLVTRIETSLPTIDFGKAQSPKLSDYADGVDTIKFQLEIEAKKV